MYFYNLIDDNNGFKRGSKQSIKLLETYENEFWEVYAKDSLLGVIGYFKVNGYYTLEGIKDPDAKLKGLVYSIEAAKMVMNYLSVVTDTIRTCAKPKDKAIQALCIKLGFKKLGIENNFIVYEKHLKGN